MLKGSKCPNCNAHIYQNDAPHKCDGEALARIKRAKLLNEEDAPMINLPLRPDGGIDLEKLTGESILSVFDQEKGQYIPGKTAMQCAVTATLERVAKWHEGQEAICIARIREAKTMSGADHLSQQAKFHRSSTAAIRAMKP